KSDVLVEEGETTSIVFKAEQSDIYFCSIPGHLAAGMVGNFEVVDSIEEEVVVQGEVPQKDGRDLNFSFESGNLEDWTATGDAFTGTPVYEDPSPVHEEETPLGAKGKYFLSSGGTENYKKTGTL